MSVLSDPSPSAFAMQRQPRQLVRMLRVTPRVVHALQRAGIRTIPALCTRTERELLLIPGLGGASLHAIKTALMVRGLALRDEGDSPVAARATCASGGA